MTAPGGPDTGLVELHRQFLEMRHSPSSEVRRRLGFQILLHRAATAQLQRAAAPLLKRLAKQSELREEILQVAALLLVRWLTAESLDFIDQGPERFGGWYWSLCRSACRGAMRKCQARRIRSIESLEESEQPLVRRPTFVDLWWDDLLAAISTIRDRRTQVVMIDMAAGRPERQTAEAYEISVATVSKLRRKGVAILRRTLQHEPADCR